MRVIKYLKNIFAGDNNIYNNISLFSILGIMSITITNIFGLYASTTYFGFPPVDRVEIILDVVVGVLIFITFCGYVFDYANKLYKDDSTLPEINIKSFLTFFKMLPLFVAWIMFFTVLIFIGLSCFQIYDFWANVYFSLVALLLPFIGIIFVMYSKEFKFYTSIYNPAPIVKVISKSFVDIITFLIQILVVGAVLVFIFKKGFVNTRNLANFPALQLAIRLVLLSSAVYVSGIFPLVLVQEFVRVIKEKSLIE